MYHRLSLVERNTLVFFCEALTPAGAERLGGGGPTPPPPYARRCKKPHTGEGWKKRQIYAQPFWHTCLALKTSYQWNHIHSDHINSTFYLSHILLKAASSERCFDVSELLCEPSSDGSFPRRGQFDGWSYGSSLYIAIYHT